MREEGEKITLSVGSVASNTKTATRSGRVVFSCMVTIVVPFSGEVGTDASVGSNTGICEV